MGNQTQSFGELLRRHRTAAGLTQEGLAERAGLSRRGIADLERGVRRAPYRDTVARLAAALELDAPERAALERASQRVVGHTARPASAAPLTSFVGRERDLEELTAVLSSTRVLTLVGSGGIGKTRLALELVSRVGGEFSDGVSLVELAALMDPHLVPHAVIAAIGLQDIGGRPQPEALVEYLRSREVLLVLDNCEHLVLACAELVDRLVNSCPKLHVLATSRERLDVPGEVVWSVPPLGVPHAQPGLTLEALDASEAGRLFIDRARSALPGLRVTPHNAEDIARVCQRLDGIPLALELAAARVKVLSVGQIAERLDDALRLLTTGGRLAPPRQQTLRATLEWSYTLLSDAEQRLFDRLCVFAGAWTLEAAEAVANDGAAENVLDDLGRLVDKSLVVVEPSEVGPPRYRLLEPVRQYAEQRLVERGDDRRVRDRHADFYLALAERLSPEIHQASALTAMELLDREHDNVRVALRWLFSIGDVERSQRLAGGMGRFWLYRSHVAEGEAWLHQALDLPGGDAPTAHRAECVSPLPVFAYARGDEVALERASQEELRLCRILGFEQGVGFALVHLGQAAMLRGELDFARQQFLAGVEASRAARSPAAETLNLIYLANVAFEQGLDDEATRYGEASLTTASEGGWTRGWTQAHCLLGQVCHRQGDFLRARRHFEASLDFARRFGARWWASRTLIHFGNMAVDEGEPRDAREYLAEGLQIAHELGDWPGIVAGLEGFSRLAQAQGDVDAGARLSAAADVIRKGSGMRERGRLVHQQPTAPAEGAVLSLEQAVDLALSL